MKISVNFLKTIVKINLNKNLKIVLGEMMDVKEEPQEDPEQAKKLDPPQVQNQSQLFSKF